VQPIAPTVRRGTKTEAKAIWKAFSPASPLSPNKDNEEEERGAE